MTDRLQAFLDWLAWRAHGRCYTCHRRVLVHTPRQVRACEVAPLSIVITAPAADPARREA